MDEGGSGDAREIPLATFMTAPPFPSGEGGGGRARQKNRGERKGKRRKWQQLSYRRKLPPSVYPTTIRSCVPSTPPACASFHRFALTPFSPSTPAVSSTLASFFPSLFLVLVSLASLPCVLADSAFPLASCWHAEIVRGSQDFWPKRLTLSHVFSYVPKRFLLDEFLRIPGHAASAMKHSEEGRNSNEFLDGTWYGFGNCVEIKRK